MKILKHIFCITTTLTLFGGGTPADIPLGQFQTLKKKIINRTITPAEARNQFQQLIGALAPQDRPKYAKIIEEITTEGKKRGIQITGNETPPGAHPKKPDIIEAPIKDIAPTPAKQKPIVIPPQKEPQVPQKQELEKESKPVQEKATRLPEAQFNALKAQFKALEKTHKQLSPAEIDRAIAQIKNGFGAVRMPLYMEKIIEKIEQFKKQLAQDIVTINTLGMKLVQQELPTIKQQLTNPKVIKSLEERAHAIEREIEPFEIKYIDNKTVQDAAIEATANNFITNLYKIVQESMQQAAKLNDNAVLNKLIRAYAFIAQQHPVYSLKHEQKKQQKELTALQKQEQEQKEAPLKNRLAEIIKRLEHNDYYTLLEPERVDEQLTILRDNFDLLTEEQKQLYEHIEDYQHYYVQNALDGLAIADKDLQEMQQALTNSAIDIAAINGHMRRLAPLELKLKQEHEESAKLHKDSWLTRTLNQFMLTLEDLGKKLYKKEASLFDKAITKAKLFMAQDPTEILEIYQELEPLNALDTYYKATLQEAKTSNKDPEFIQKLEDKLAILQPHIKMLAAKKEELEKKREQEEREVTKNRQEELAEMERITKELESQGSGFKGDIELTSVPSTQSLKETNLPKSPGLSKVKDEEERQLKDIATRGLTREIHQ